MCRTTSNEYLHFQGHLRRLKITAFYLRLSLSSSSTLLPETVSLVILPRAGSLHVNGSKVHSDSPAFISLHRVLSPDDGAAVFASKDRLRASEGFSFEIHAAQHRLLHGLFRRHDDVVSAWRMDCKCADGGGIDSYVAREAEVSVVLEDGQVLTEKVVSRPRRCRRRGFRVGLEDIPEEADEGSDECCCCCDDVVSTSESDSDDEFDNCDDADYCKEMEMEMETELNEGVGWAVDVGIWVVCLGVGLLVSTASARKLRRRKLLR